MSARAKDIHVAPIDGAAAREIVRRVHYSHKALTNSQLHLGVFLAGRLEGAMQFGPPLDKRKLIGLVRDTPWNGFLELNRMAFSERLPRNSESRALGVALRMIRKHYPHVQWVVSFADATQCGDGTIYRASGFVLTGITKNKTIWAIDGVQFSDVGYRTGGEMRQLVNRVTMTKGKHVCDDGARGSTKLREMGAAPLEGHQLRYVYFLDPSARERLTVEVIEFAQIEAAGAGMYRGQKRVTKATADSNQHGGGAIPTHPLHSSEKEEG